MDSGFESIATFKELRRQEVGFTCSLRRTPTPASRQAMDSLPSDT
jgi:hypothetical protein